jgi:hypothetical protein
VTREDKLQHLANLIETLTDEQLDALLDLILPDIR